MRERRYAGIATIRYSEGNDLRPRLMAGLAARRGRFNRRGAFHSRGASARRDPDIRHHAASVRSLGLGLQPRRRCVAAHHHDAVGQRITLVELRPKPPAPAQPHRGSRQAGG